MQDTQKNAFSSAVRVAEDDIGVSVGFLGSIAGSQGLILQRGKGDDEEAPGIYGVYVKLAIQKHAMGGGISNFLLARKYVIIDFDENGKINMGGLDNLMPRFELGDSDFDKLRTALQYIFIGCQCYSEEIRS